MATEKPSINKIFALLLTYFQYRINESTRGRTICDAWSDLDKWILQEWIDWEQSFDYGGIIFSKHSIVCWIMLVVKGAILASILLSTWLTLTSILGPVISYLFCNLSLAQLNPYLIALLLGWS